MKKELLFAFAAFFMMSLSTITGVFAGEDRKGDTITIVKDEADLSGDGKKDSISIEGTRYEEDSDFLREVFLQIKASNGERFKVELEPGYDPQLQFIDVNGDGVKEIYISVATGGSGGLSNFYLYTLKDFNLKDLTVPDPVMMTTQFLDNYKASISIQETGETYTFDLKSRAEDYEKSGLYNHGKLNEPTELMVDSYSSLKPITLKDGSTGLKGIQRVSGSYHADSIAFVESIWKYNDGKWTLDKVKVVDIESSKKKKK
ncbi:hypothetical protein [Cytobacillus purgationiresistens]|uniref:VCBS repeat-containing protein n=1 Tax=Cytobacillus purgationiresistens TaxID=863449 RepID=A0ABU0ABG4_9BACI|nr:hypothetical protein [Cytobacillus purgationiresistens]MDQ0268598.1 hypothetical protein [Cytobacillus purgationiresistens]